MKSKPIFLVLCLSLLVFHLHAQVLDRWYFGFEQGILFTVDGVVLDTNSQQWSWEGCATQVNESGDLLFYASPEQVWDSSHNMMPNGDSLDGHISSVEGVLSIPVPNDPSKFYIFVLDAQEVGPNWGKLSYSVVDMTLNGGLGDVIIGQKNILVNDSTQNETLLAVRRQGSANEEYWLIVKTAHPQYLVYRIHAGGVDFWNDFSLPNGGPQTSVFYMNPAGNMLAIGNTFNTPSTTKRGVYFVRFDPVLGVLGDLIFIQMAPLLNLNHQMSGGEFSKSGRYFYTSARVSTTPFISSIIAYDLSVWDSLTIQNNVDTIHILSIPTFVFRRAINDTIYITRPADSAGYFLATIGNIEKLSGPAIFNSTGQALIPTNIFGTGLPTTIVQPTPTFYVADACIGDSVLFYFSGVGDSVEWHFGDGSTSSTTHPKHLYADTGLFSVTLFIYLGSNIDTIVKTILVRDTVPNPLFPEVYDLCDNGLVSVDLTSLSFDSLRWSDGSTASIRGFSDTTTLSLSVYGKCNTVNDVLRISASGGPIVLDISDTTLCEATSIAVAPTLQGNFLELLWSTGDTLPTITIDASLSPDLSPIDLWLIATNACGSDTDTFTLSFISTPVATLPSDTNLCIDATFYIYHQGIDQVNYTWNTGDTNMALAIDTSSIVWLAAHNSCGADTDTMRITFYPEIKVALGQDTFLCPGDSLVLDATWPGASYSWTPGGSSAPSATVNYNDLMLPKEQRYVVTITADPCVVVASRTIRIIDDRCDSSLCKFSIPNVFTPNGDGINDVLKVTNACNGVQFNIFIYNRWGQLVFQGNHTIGTWDGTINGQLASAGTYFVVAEQDSGFVMRNAVQLIR